MKLKLMNFGFWVVLISSGSLIHSIKLFGLCPVDIPDGFSREISSGIPREVPGGSS